EETLKSISSHKGIVGTILTDSLGIPIKSSMDHATTTQYARYVALIVMKSKNLAADIEPTDTMMLVRVRTKLHELIVVPSEDYYIIIVQKVVVGDEHQHHQHHHQRQ
ncbi:hypothetical protein SELMODRAFT_88969, partial [Selaginella moellendorffii]